MLESGEHSTKTRQLTISYMSESRSGSHIYVCVCVLSRAIAAWSHSFYKLKIRIVHDELKKQLFLD